MRFLTIVLSLLFVWNVYSQISEVTVYKKSNIPLDIETYIFARFFTLLSNGDQVNATFVDHIKSDVNNKYGTGWQILSVNYSIFNDLDVDAISMFWFSLSNIHFCIFKTAILGSCSSVVIGSYSELAATNTEQYFDSHNTYQFIRIQLTMSRATQQ